MDILQHEAVKNLRVLTYGAGEEIIREGECTPEIYILLSGFVEVLKGETVVASESRPGSLFGEMSVLMDSPHTATVRTREPSAFHLAREGRDLLDHHPDIGLHVAEMLARRLQAVTVYVADVKRQFADQQGHLGMVDGVLETLLNKSPRRVERGERGH